MTTTVFDNLYEKLKDLNDAIATARNSGADVIIYMVADGKLVSADGQEIEDIPSPTGKNETLIGLAVKDGRKRRSIETSPSSPSSAS